MHSFSYLNVCKCRVFRIASKPCKTILVTLDCSQCDGSRLKMYNRCHNMREWADTLQSLKLYLCVLSSIKRCRHYHVIYFTNERYHKHFSWHLLCFSEFREVPAEYEYCAPRIESAPRNCPVAYDQCQLIALSWWLWATYVTLWTLWPTSDIIIETAIEWRKMKIFQIRLRLQREKHLRFITTSIQISIWRLYFSVSIRPNWTLVHNFTHIPDRSRHICITTSWHN